ncbi:hypothetical protein DFH09DRAFT_1186236 [Mycena vulgaris]|nr:hypothetical protein DFH09DRAFT_1186236 [Mycena vulgaris]
MSLWNVTIQDNSPFISYSPFADAGLAHGWQPWYSKSGFLKEPGEGGVGDSFHSTALPGASFNLEFHGTGVNLYGTTNSSYAVTIDNVAQKIGTTRAEDLIFTTSSLKDGAHNLTLAVNPSKPTQQFAFDRAVVFSPVKALPSPVFYDNTDSRLSYSGTWKAASAPGIPNATVTHPYKQTSTAGSSVSFNFTGAVGVALHGPVNWGDWVYTVDLDGRKTSYNASTYWKIPDALRFFQAGLDPTATHTLTLANPSAQMTLSLNSITLYTLAGVANGTVSSASASASKSVSGSVSASASASASVSASVSASASGSASATNAGPPGASDAGNGTAVQQSVAPSATGTGGALNGGIGRADIVTMLACGLLWLSLF